MNLQAVARLAWYSPMITSLLVFIRAVPARYSQMMTDPFAMEAGLRSLGFTHLIYILFNPLRLRLQDLIDRRFYRQKYDAEKALADFAAAARNETNLSQLANQLTRTVQETMQPVQVGLWLGSSKGMEKM